ncbi:MAG TPA: ATP-binding protein [Promineifilum sp.]|nr:ATP-binding protein [Promineifilum sp.]HRO92004.1 ATP-binding protein [Promineifilum sp.]HRQ14722.1 ATP-binding protein [Promineifilum sp.]
MKSLLSLHRRVAWLHLFSYLVIVLIELIVLRNLSGTLEANVVRYLTFFAVVLGSLLVIRRRIIRPIEEMKEASLRIAAGNYQERLPTYSTIELNELAQAFNRMVATIESTEERRIMLLSDVAHELRTPLSNIRATMEGLIDEVLPADPDTFFDIQREVGRLQRLVQQLDALSRAESDRLPLNKQPADIAALAQRVCDRLSIQYEDKEVALELEAADDLPPLSVDPDLITQVLTNLLGNALQYTPRGGQVRVIVARQRGDILIRVADNGIGIPAEDLTRIFERFYRVDKSRARQSGGNGIGLTIAAHLVRAHNGRIWAESDGPGHGATLSFTLPLQ